VAHLYRAVAPICPPDQGFTWRPDLRVARNLHVRLCERTIVPGVFRAIDGVLFILESEISNDFRFAKDLQRGFRIFRGSFRLVGRNLQPGRRLGGINPVMPASMCHAIYLDCQKDWNPAFFKIARKLDHG